MSISMLFNKAVSHVPVTSSVDVEETVDDLTRIELLPRRQPFNCTRDPITKLYDPRTTALISIMTSRFARPTRLSCACRPRLVHLQPDGVLVIFRILPEGIPPDPPILTTVDAFVADQSPVIQTEIAAAEEVKRLRPGGEVSLPAADGGVGHSCIKELNAIQSWVLHEAPICGGVVGYISVGGGKSVCGILAPLAFPDCKLAVLLGEPGQRRHYRSQYLRIREHFRVPSFVLDEGPGWTVPGTPPLHFIPYSKLSSQSSSDLLERLDPDMIIFDEAHRVVGKNSARGRRTKRFLSSKILERETAIAEGKPVRARAVRVLAWSGTLEARSVTDTQGVCAFALGDGSPLPIDKHEAERWSAVMDPVRMPDRTSPTARRLQKAFTGQEYEASPISMLLAGGPDSAIRKGFCARRMQTRGVVTTTESSIAASILFHRYDRDFPTPLPTVVKDALAKVREGERPDGDLLAEKAKQVMCAKSVSCGFFPYWKFDKHETDERILAWYAARKLFMRELRAKLLFGEVHLDSENLCKRAAERFWRGRDTNGKPIMEGSATCETCENEGAIGCTSCNGKGVKGVFEDTCETCKGEGRLQCPTCLGTCVGLYQGKLPTWASDHWPAWRDIMDKVKHEERIRWIGHNLPEAQDPATHPGYFLARSVAAWAKANKGVVWCQSRAMGNKIAELSGLPYHDGGEGGEDRLRAEKGDRSVIVSIRAFGFGFDSLQEKFNEQVITEFPSSNLVSQQLMGRLHRPGQQHDEVITRACLHTTELMDALRKSVVQAEFNAEMLATAQLLTSADFSFDF